MNKKKFDDYEGWDETQGLPTRENCDLDNPRQMFLWMFTAMPGVKGAPMILPGTYWELQSFRMWELGARLGADPVLKYRHSGNSMLNRHTAAGKWVSLDEPDAPSKTLADVVEEMPQADQMALREVMLQKMGLGAGVPPDEPGRVRVSVLAGRLGMDPDRLMETLSNMGVDSTPDSFLERDTAERVAAHVGVWE